MPVGASVLVALGIPWEAILSFVNATIEAADLRRIELDALPLQRGYGYFILRALGREGVIYYRRTGSHCIDLRRNRSCRFESTRVPQTCADLMTTIGNVGFQTESSAILNKEATVSNSKHYGNHGTSNGNHRKSKGRQ